MALYLNTPRFFPRLLTHYTHPLCFRRMATITTTTPQSAQAAFATIDLSGYDAEQSRLMDERCIVVDEHDRAIGALDKKTCMCKRTLL
jgi:hypothetical protein